MRRIAGSFLIITAACVVAPPTPSTTPIAVTPAAPQSANAPLAISDDAFALLEHSPTIDGDRVSDVARGAAATLVVVFASWCEHCQDQLAVIDEVRAHHPGLRTLGVNYRPHEEYDDLGDSQRVRAYVAAHAPWLIVVPASDRLFFALGRPPKVPTLYVYDRTGHLVELWDRRTRALPTSADLDELLARLGA